MAFAAWPAKLPDPLPDPEWFPDDDKLPECE
jgi:hypothetical protein